MLTVTTKRSKWPKHPSVDAWINGIHLDKGMLLKGVYSDMPQHGWAPKRRAEGRSRVPEATQCDPTSVRCPEQAIPETESMWGVAQV